MNRITKLKESSVTWIEDEQEIKNHVLHYFQSIFYGGSMDCEQVFELVLLLISDADNADLCAPFSNEEFRATLFQMHPDNALGPDGLNPVFYQRFWHLIGNDVSDGCRLWLQQCIFPSLSETLIVLIPKMDSPETVKNFRPIALCNVLYKIVAKVLANKFKRVLLMIISKNQSAFIPHRLITDNIIVAFEMIHNMKINKGRNYGNCALKIDISKAYDMVEWEFLKGMLERFGFSTQWIRGLRQGILFLRISIWCVRKAYRYYLKMLNLGAGCKAVGQVLNEADNIKSILNTYAAAFGQVVNFNKSSIFFSPNIVSSVRSNISNILDVHSPLRVFKAKYFPNGDLFSVNVSNGANFVWKSVMASRELIRRVTRWRVDNGEKVLVASAPWISKEDIFFADDGPDFIEPHLCVCDLFEGNGRVWNIAFLMKLFSPRDFRAIISIPISITNKEDSFLWHFDKRGVYTVKSAYFMYMDLLGRSSFNVGGELWTSLWNVSVPPKVKNFCWRVCRNILPTKDNLRQKGWMLDVLGAMKMKVSIIFCCIVMCPRKFGG
ncbi:uncharacterized protein LOC122723283 [Manihot esculenta]|uniref:uncharacterized protein LOC122723283 n=1 Tax=Manihot esculenta TaxID=3983 RepID=UPI001CC753C5|nr:uncharacterized protein LOC122723283 [Manihot esculenta]